MGLRRKTSRPVETEARRPLDMNKSEEEREDPIEVLREKPRGESRLLEQMEGIISKKDAEIHDLKGRLEEVGTVEDIMERLDSIVAGVEKLAGNVKEAVSVLEKRVVAAEEQVGACEGENERNKEVIQDLTDRIRMLTGKANP